MAPGLRCRVCSGELRLLLPGADAPMSASAFSPSCHELGLHGDLLVCRECGAVEQPALPSGADLHDLYRDTRDGSYLDEEHGRRATARRLLELIGEQVPSGRLLDVGCGPGLLLDEAAHRGYEVVGVELSRDAARHARATFGLDVREEALEDFDDPARIRRRGARGRHRARRGPGRRDRAAARSCCARAACCASSRPIPPRSPPASRGARWWGYLARAHVPAAAPHAARAAARRRDSSSPATCRSCARSPRAAGSAASPSASGRCSGRWSAVARRVPAQASLSLSLGDERVILAHRTSRSSTPLSRS